MRTVNVRLLMILLGIVAVVGISVFVLNRVQVRRNAGDLLVVARQAKEKAAEASKAKDRETAGEQFKAAAKNYNDYFKLRPDDLDARKEFGDYLAELGDFAGAINAFEQILRQDETRSKDRRKLVEMAIDQAARIQMMVADSATRTTETLRWYRVANNHLQDYLLKEFPEDASLWDMAGRCQAALAQEGQEAEAIASYEKALELKPDQVETYGRLANFLRQRFGTAKAKEADGWIEKLLEANPESVEAHLLAGKYYQANGDAEKASDEAERAMAFDEENRDALLLAAQCSQAKATKLLQKRKVDEARKEIENARGFAQRGVALHADDVAFYITAAQIEAGVNDVDKAIGMLQQGLRATSNNPLLLWYTADWMIQARRLDEAKAVMDLLSKASVSDARRGFMQGQFEFAESHWKEAIDLLEQARGGLALDAQLLNRTDFLLGRAYAALGNADQATRALRRALDSDPFNSQAQAAMVDVLLAQGKIEAATEIYRQLLGRQIAISPRAAARITLMKHAQGKASERDWLELDALLDKAAKDDPESTEIPLLRFDTLLARGKADEAEQMLTECRDAAPDKREYWNALINLAQRRQQWDKADALMKDAQKKFGFPVELRLAMVRSAVLQKGKEGFVRLRQAADKLDNFSDKEKVALLQGLLAIAQQCNANEEAALFAGKLAELLPNDVQVRFQIFEMAMREGNVDALERLLGDIEKIEGKGAFWNYARAAWLALSAKDSTNDPRLDEALKHLARAAELRPSWERVPVLAASILDQQKKTDEALIRYREAVKLGDRSPGGLRRLAQILFERQAFAESRAVLQLLGSYNDNRDVERLASRNEFRAGEFEKALTLARKAADGSTNFGDYVWLATLLDASARRAAAEGQGMRAEELRDEAEASFRKSVELADKAPEAWIPLIRFLAANGKREKADEAIEQFRPKIDAKDATLVLAQCYEAAGDMEKAKAQYETALAAAADNPAVILTVAEFLYNRDNRSPESETLIRRLTGGKVAASEDELCRARRMLAVLLATRGGYANAQEALGLVETNLKRDASQPQDQRIKASVLATLPSRAEREKAAEVFERLISSADRKSVSPEDQFILAQLYLAQGDSGWNKFTTQMRELISSQANDPKYLAFYISAMLKKGEVQNAELYLPRLEKAGPNLFATASLKADLMFRRGQYEEALQLLKGFIDKSNAVPTDRSARMRLVAESLEQLAAGMTGDAAQTMRPTYVRNAEMIFRQYVDLHPGEDLLLVGFLTRLGLINEAVDALERIAASENTPGAIAQAVAELLRSRLLDKAQGERAETALKAALERYKRPTPLLILLADMYTEQSRCAEAEAFYREVLQNEANNPVAMNNLAVLLALQKIKLREALKLMNRALEIAGPVAQMYDSRATVYMAMGDAAKAMQDIDQAMLDLDGPIQHFHRAQACLLSGEKEAAAAAFGEAKKKGLLRANLPTLEQPIFDQLEALGQ